MIYIVTLSEVYYPCGGTEDWELVTRDYEAAKLRAEGLLESCDSKYHAIGIIKINEDNLHVQQEWVE